MQQRGDAVEVRLVAADELDAVGTDADGDGRELDERADGVLGEARDKAVDRGEVAAVGDSAEKHRERFTGGECVVDGVKRAP